MLSKILKIIFSTLASLINFLFSILAELEDKYNREAMLDDENLDSYQLGSYLSSQVITKPQQYKNILNVFQFFRVISSDTVLNTDESRKLILGEFIKIIHHHDIDRFITILFRHNRTTEQIARGLENLARDYYVNNTNACNRAYDLFSSSFFTRDILCDLSKIYVRIKTQESLSPDIELSVPEEFDLMMRGLFQQFLKTPNFNLTDTFPQIIQSFINFCIDKINPDSQSSPALLVVKYDPPATTPRTKPRGLRGLRHLTSSTAGMNKLGRHTVSP